MKPMLRSSMIALVIGGPNGNDRSLLIEADLGGHLGIQSASSSRIMLDSGTEVLDTTPTRRLVKTRFISPWDGYQGKNATDRIAQDAKIKSSHSSKGERQFGSACSMFVDSRHYPGLK
jgi:hypothetical protein